MSIRHWQLSRVDVRVRAAKIDLLFTAISSVRQESSTSFQYATGRCRGWGCVSVCCAKVEPGSVTSVNIRGQSFGCQAQTYKISWIVFFMGGSIYMVCQCVFTFVFPHKKTNVYSSN